VLKDKRHVLVLAGIACLGASALTGCRGDSRSELAKATDKARRLYGKACGLLKDPVYRLGQQYVPVTKEMPDPDANAIKLVPFGTVNPKVDDVLTQATEGLAGAIEGGPEAPIADRAGAHAMLARVQALTGYRYAIEAAQQRDRAWRLLRKLENAVIEMGDHGKRIANCDALLSVTDKSLDDMTAKAKDDASASQAKITDLKGKIATLKKEKATLQAQNDTLLAAARKLRVDSQLADVLKGIELFDQARAKEDQATANSVRLTEIEDAVQFCSMQIATLELDVAAAGKRTAAAGKIIATRQQRKADTQQKRGDFVKLLTETQKGAEGLAGEVINVCQKASGMEAKAVAAYDQAATQYDRYGKLTGGAGAGDEAAAAADPAVVATLGDMRMERASLRVRILALQKRIAYVVDEATKLWSGLPVQNSVPDLIGKVAGYVADEKKARDQAQEDYRWAAKSYEKALNDIPREQRWSYQLQIASAYAGLYRISGDSEARQKGTAALEALGDQEASRYVAKHAAHFRKLLSGTAGGAPGAASAPATP